ncbi:hypothetical protein PHMEG_00033510 [Phytophthora megakarya]|uniref:Uncharacterized protein n=1 Tax=Phytophthora megakarya TaxID=4795 RepID=A0A225UTE3_9STRA|nr:hypothetical protein PHMEG_00033510 [Phytophthora megakarya]
MSPNGLSNIIKNIRRRRQARYYKLYTLFADRHGWSLRRYDPLCELLIQTMSVRKVLRVDTSAKLCKKLKVWDGSDNEIIVGRRLTKSENNEKTGALLGNLIPTLKTNGDGCIYLVSDNANCVRGMVQATFDGGVQVKQDSFHVMMRIKERIASKAKKSGSHGCNLYCAYKAPSTRRQVRTQH